MSFFQRSWRREIRMTTEKLIQESLKEEIDILVDAERYQR
jgi:hypothetical protein